MCLKNINILILKLFGFIYKSANYKSQIFSDFFQNADCLIPNSFFDFKLEHYEDLSNS